jgi:hypothetical protein
MRTEIEVQDLLELFEYLTSANAQYTLAGGLAVGLWADKLFVEKERDRFGLPIYSEDVDFRGYRFLADGIKAWMNSQGLEITQISVAIRKGAESMGRIFNMPFRPLNSFSSIRVAATVEILERLPLLDSGIDDPPNGTVVVLKGVHVLDPFSLMICKLHAFHTRPQAEQGHDLDHLKILAALLPGAEALCRTLGVDLSKDATRLQSVLNEGRFALPQDFAEEELVREAIASAMK